MSNTGMTKNIEKGNKTSSNLQNSGDLSVMFNKYFKYKNRNV